MFKHEKILFHPVGVERANPQYAVLLQEQLGGGNGELKAAMQYLSQSFRIKDPEIKDLFMDIAAEELGHMEMVAQTINLLNGHVVDADAVPAGEIQTHVQLGLNPGLINSSGYSWTADYVTVTGEAYKSGGLGVTDSSSVSPTEYGAAVKGSTFFIAQNFFWPSRMNILSVLVRISGLWTVSSHFAGSTSSKEMEIA